MPVIVYHNPKCSKSRQTLELLNRQGIKPTIIEYLKTPPSSKKLKEIIELLRFTPRNLIRKQEATYTENKLDDFSLSDDGLIEAMAKHPILIERPIVIVNDKAVIGRPPEEVLKII